MFRRPFRAAALAGGLLALVALLLAQGEWGGAALAQSASGPVPADGASVARGQEIYQQACAMCHGFQGRGDGPLARTLAPRPSDFRIHMAEGHPPEQIFEWIANGVPGTPDHAFGEQLSVDDTWHVFNYLQTFAPALP
jgi:mono/diheme cytochrome c family protein